MVPEKLYPPTKTPPKGYRITRGFRAILCEKRVPYSIQIPLDRSLSFIGIKTKTIKVGPFFVTFRRNNVDNIFIQSVLIDKEYFWDGYSPHPEGIVIDIGANIGTFTLAVKAVAPLAQVISVEPFPDSVDLLRRNIVQNALQNIHVVPAAISDRNGHGLLHIGSSPGFHSMKFDTGRGHIVIDTLTLAELFHRFGIDRCDLLKIDCEGAEFDFLPKLEPDLGRRIGRILMEFSAPIPGWTSANPTDPQIRSKLQFGDSLIDILVANGFVIDRYLDCVGFRAGYIFAHR